MKRLLLGCMLLVAITAFGQKNKTVVLAKEKSFGMHLTDSSAIKGMEYTFSNRIQQTYIDTTTGYLTVQLRGLSKNKKWLKPNGKIIQYDMKKKSILWSKSINYELNVLQQFNDIMIYGSPVKSSYLDINTGNELSELKNFIYLVNHIDNIGIGYKVKKSANVTDELEGLDLNNGKILWKRDLKKDFGWNDHFYINDTTILIVSSGLHSINLRTGNGWDYNTITGEKDYTKNIAANAAGIALGLLTGVYVFTFGDNTVFDLASNTLVDSSHLYFASKEQLVKIDKQSGEIAWKYPFYGDFTSKSSIFTIGNHIFMVNLGRAFVRGKSIDFGKPFFASFDKQTGKEIFISVIEMKDNPILNFSISHDEIFLIFKDRIKKYSLETGSEIKEKEFPKDTFGELRYLVGNHVYTITEDNTVSNLLKSDSTKVFIITSQDKILSVDNDLNVAKTINIKDINICYAQTKHLKFIAKDDYTLVINNEGTTIAEIGASTNAVIKGKTLYDFKDDKFISIDLQRLFTDKN